MAGVEFKRLLGLYPNARIAVEVAFGADLAANPATWTWVDVTTDVRFGGRVTISPMGRGDETTKAQPAGCTFRLDNRSGAYSKGPGSAHYPYVRRNTPVRVRVTLDGATWYTRFQGYANGFPPGWDAEGKLPYVKVSASGILRRLQQGKTPFRSPLYRAIAALTPYAHWPCEDLSGATLVGAATNASKPLTLSSGTATYGVAAGALAGAAGVLEMRDAVFVGRMDVSTTSTQGWVLDVRWRATQISAGVSVYNPLVWTTADGVEWVVQMTDTGVVVTTRVDPNGPYRSVSCSPFDGNWHRLTALVVPSGGSAVRMDIWVDGSTDFDTSGPGTFTFSNLGGEVRTNDEAIIGSLNVDKFYLSHIAFFERTTVVPMTLDSAGVGYTGETATARITRLCAEEGVPVDVRVNADAPSPVMAAQGIDTLVNLLAECETTDDGVLYDGRGPGLAYASRGVRYNAATALTVAAAAGQLADPFDPADDDQRNRNKATVTRKGGSSATYEDVDGPLGTAAIGVYDAKVSPDPNYIDDSGNYFRAAWEVHKGTVEADYRYPSLSLDLCAVPALAATWLAADVSNRIDVTGVDSAALTHPAGDIDIMLEGWAEAIAPNQWTAGCNCSPFEPHRVAVIEGAGDTALRIDSGSSTLAASRPAGATTISVASSNPVELWSTVAGDYPRDIDVGGVKVRATAVAGAVSPQTFTVDPAPYPLTGGAQVKLWRPPTIAL